ncbi:hypothetical protein NQ315_003939 [Exocentrus adspersus]|uniref:Uncharacterized protein n=1 Tax=Exocentrus adspersus TaxID=1586481 RepID=A0AAV8VYP9_9CUCU|nr:hypothetical protein NQ315_003939 [Exocentrus adspersus]
MDIFIKEDTPKTLLEMLSFRDYKQQGRLGMDNNEYNYEGNLEERKITYDSHTKFKRNRRVRQAPSHDNYSPYEPHHNHFNPHNHHHGYHGQPHGHHHPHHFAPSPHGSPHGPPYPAQGPWNDHGHDHNDNNGGGRPWKGHGGYDDEEDNCDPYGELTIEELKTLTWRSLQLDDPAVLLKGAQLRPILILDFAFPMTDSNNNNNYNPSGGQFKDVLRMSVYFKLT